MFYKVTGNTELANTEILLLGSYEPLVMFYQLLHKEPCFFFFFFLVFVICVLDYVEVCSLYTHFVVQSFYHKWMPDVIFVKTFSLSLLR